MGKPRNFFSRGRRLQTVDRMLADHQRAGLILQRAGSSDGAEWVVGGRSLRNFGSCSYMGLEQHPDLVAGGLHGIQRFGSNFSISRAYLDCPLYTALEETLSRVLGRYALVTPSTTLAHLAALPVLVGDHDLVIVDQFAHASIHMATELVTDRPIELLRHNRMDLLEQRLAQADAGTERIWFVCDGIYSMLGDYAPFAELSALLERYPKLHLYVDDAHAMSWLGAHGRGAALTFLGEHPRVVVAVSLSKAFGATGGALALPTAELRDRVRRCGGPMLFSGPIPPAGLGSALASAELHLSAEFSRLQADLRERIAFARTALHEVGVALAVTSDTPILVIHHDSVPEAQAVVGELRERGFFTCISTFPAVPMNKPSIRFTVSRHNSFADIRDLVDALAEITHERQGSPHASGERATLTMRRE